MASAAGGGGPGPGVAGLYLFVAVYFVVRDSAVLGLLVFVVVVVLSLMLSLFDLWAAAAVIDVVGVGVLVSLLFSYASDGVRRAAALFFSFSSIGMLAYAAEAADNIRDFSVFSFAVLAAAAVLFIFIIVAEVLSEENPAK